MWEKFLEEKIYTKDSIQVAVARWKLKNKRIVFTNGCFDLMHLGHINYLMQAIDLGDQLIIGLNSDSSTRKLKGPNRPVNDENSRIRLLASLFFVSGVVMFDEDTPYELIKAVQPDVLVKGGDYKPEDIVGADIVTASGGEVKVIEFLSGYSSSLIEKKIIDSNK
jgi:D-glycero-beta-D-manno-heptose 1-phosphate adenylyltransferase